MFLPEIEELSHLPFVYLTDWKLICGRDIKQFITLFLSSFVKNRPFWLETHCLPSSEKGKAVKA